MSNNIIAEEVIQEIEKLLTDLDDSVKIKLRAELTEVSRLFFQAVNNYMLGNNIDSDLIHLRTQLHFLTYKQYKLVVSSIIETATRVVFRVGMSLMVQGAERINNE